MLTLATLGALLPRSRRVRRGVKNLYQTMTRTRWHDQPGWWEAAKEPAAPGEPYFTPNPQPRRRAMGSAYAGGKSYAPAYGSWAASPSQKYSAFGGGPFGWNPGATGLQSDIDAYNKANARRLNQIMGMLNRVGGAERGAISRQERADLATMKQGLINKGLGASSVIAPMLNRVRESAGYRRQRLAEMLAQQRAGVLERVEDVPPPVSRYLDTLERLNQYRSY